jgi:hypothetical protein
MTIKQHILRTEYIYLFCVDLRTNSHYFPVHKLIRFYNRDTMSIARYEQSL